MGNSVSGALELPFCCKKGKRGFEDMFNQEREEDGDGYPFPVYSGNGDQSEVDMEHGRLISSLKRP